MAIDNTFERIDRSLQGLENEVRLLRSELTAEVHAINHRMTQIGFGLAGILAAGLIALAGTKL